MDMAGKYVDGFVVPVPKANIEAYKKVSETMGRVWKEHGALAYVECVADDVKPGKVTSFPQAVDLKDDEVVVFSWIVYESREQLLLWAKDPSVVRILVSHGAIIDDHPRDALMKLAEALG